MYKEAIKIWGNVAQIRMLMEESSELIEVCNKIIHNTCKKLRKGNTELPFEDSNLVDRFAEEVADTILMLEQIYSDFDIEKKISDFRESKLQRLKEKLASYKPAIVT